jgi:hypothetical protein
MLYVHEYIEMSWNVLGFVLGVKSNPLTVTLTHCMIYTSVYVTYGCCQNFGTTVQVENKAGMVFLEDNVNWMQMVSIA